MELIREHFRSIIFTTFDVDYHDQSDELKSLFGDKAASYRLWKTGLKSSIVDDGG